MFVVCLVLLLFTAGTALPQGTRQLSESPNRGEEVMKALAAAYPEQVGPAVFRNGDWAVPVMGDWFYYAQGRLLPEDLRARAADYDPQPFYTYLAELPPWREPDPADAERASSAARQRREHPPRRSRHFFDALYRADSREAAYEQLKTIRFLGKTVLIHYSIMEELALVELRINREARTDPQVRQWINSLTSISAWNWRNIAQTQSRSYHAYGAAIDLLPTNYRNLGESYGLWAAEKNLEWWRVPYDRRLHPPARVIRAFEAYGFIWGGKWLFYDTMHFEYRPEILILSQFPLRRW
jgi:hypothetical protein